MNAKTGHYLGISLILLLFSPTCVPAIYIGAPVWVILFFSLTYNREGSGKNIHCLYNGIDRPRFSIAVSREKRSDLRAHLGISPDKFVFLYSRRSPLSNSVKELAEGGNAVVVRRGDGLTDRLAAAMLDLYAKPEKRRELSLKGKACAAEFSKEHYWDRFVELAKRLCA